MKKHTYDIDLVKKLCKQQPKGEFNCTDVAKKYAKKQGLDYSVSIARSIQKIVENYGLHTERINPKKHMQFTVACKRRFVQKKRAAVRHQGGVADAPIILFGAFPEEKPPRGLFVGGLDGYKLDVAKTDSLGSGYVLKRRNQAPNEPCETIACSYTARPERMRDFNINCEKMFDTWNAECLMESIDLSFKQHLEQKGREYDILAPAITFRINQ